MSRPRTITDQAILDAARIVFTRDGPGASTATVARAAGISEGTLFKRFTSKEVLLAQALRCPQALWNVATTERLGQGDVRVQLQAIIGDLIGFYRQVLPRMMALMSSGAFEPATHWRADPEGGPVMAVQRLSEWASAEMALGRLRRCEPEIVARTMTGACHQFVFFELAGLQTHVGIREESTFKRELADLLMTGLVQSGPETAAAEEMI